MEAWAGTVRIEDGQIEIVLPGVAQSEVLVRKLESPRDEVARYANEDDVAGHSDGTGFVVLGDKKARLAVLRTDDDDGTGRSDTPDAAAAADTAGPSARRAAAYSVRPCTAFCVAAPFSPCNCRCCPWT
mmetsp:Transcript_6609/g.11975  ORF Transcript_6609/g.11975 Transcript_6609/m.11975 type:complete len:129 (-) Transcript_6609:29-415(-)